MTENTNPSFPIGKYEPAPFSEKLRESRLADILFLPRQLEYAVLNLDEWQLDTPYRDGGWTVRQLVHHVADSHMNAYIRFKLGMTEDNPTIKPYDQDAWVKLHDVANVPTNISLTLLHALHTRWYDFLKSLSEGDLHRTVVHPESGKQFTLWEFLGLYAWHGRHHVAHITALRERMGW
jgi:uncharacterized damage-inducible protein DinB